MKFPLLGVFAFLVLIPFGFNTTLSGQTTISEPAVLGSPSNRIKAADLQADVGVLIEALESLHPGLYRYNTKEQFASNVSALRASLGKDQSMAEAYLSISQFLATLKCGHTYCNFYNQPQEIVDSLFKNIDRVPFHFRWVGKKMIVTKDRSENPMLQPGVEVVSINGVLCSEILSRMMMIARADGGNDGKRVNWLSVQANDEFEAFDIFLPLFYPALKSPFELVIRDGKGRSAQVVVNGLTYEQRVEPYNAAKARKKNGEVMWDWTQLNDDTQYLRMADWAVYNSEWDWQSWLTERLDELAASGAPNLIVDLRGNEGGLDCGDLILARLIERDVQTSTAQRFVRYRKVPETLNAYCDTWDDTFRDWGAAATEVPTPALVAGGGQTFYQLALDDADSGVKVLKPQAPRYAGRVFVIVDASCSSATSQFARTIKDHKLGTLVGQTTGGNRRGINGGAFFFLRLPKTKIEIDLPLKAGFSDPTEPDAGIEPDVVVLPSVKTIETDQDAELLAIRQMIQASK